MDASRMGARPAAGPLIVTYEPPKNGKTNPAIIADVMPVMGGAPEATAMPSENGSEISETTRPAKMSWRQCFRPAMPFWGISRGTTERVAGWAMECEATDMFALSERGWATTDGRGVSASENSFPGPANPHEQIASEPAPSNYRCASLPGK